jgi:hypothetical protein
MPHFSEMAYFQGLESLNRALAEYRVELIKFIRREIWARGRYPIIVRAQNRD